MTRNGVLDIINTLYAARDAGESLALQSMIAADATFETPGDKALLDVYPSSGPMRLAPAVEQMMAFITIQHREMTSVVIEGRKAAITSRLTAQFAHRPGFETLTQDVWELNEDGKVTSLVQFVDTAKLAQEMNELATSGI